MKVRLRRIIGTFLILCMCITILPVQANAATNEAPNYTTAVTTYEDLQSRLNSLIAKYNGTYWTTTGTASDSSGSTSKYYYGIQCKGFASYIFNDLFCAGYIGPYDSEKYYIPNPTGATLVGKAWNFGSTDTETVKRILDQGSVGDFIQVRRRGKDYGHTMILAGKDDNGIWIFDCNHSGTCDVAYYYQNYATFASKNVGMSLYHSTSYPEPAMSFDFCNQENNMTISGTYKFWWKQTGYGTCDVNLDIDGRGLCTIYPDNNGYFSYDLDTTNFANGTYTLGAIIRSTNGAESYVTRTIIINNDTEAPVISNVHIFNLTSGGYYISCIVTDDQAVQRVTFATWTEANDQDDIIVPEVSPDGNLYIYQVKTADHNNESGPYVTHIYAYDAEGNTSNYRASTIILPKDYPIAGTNITLAYLEREDGIHIVSCNQLQKDAAGALVIPEQIDGKPVVAIDNDVFFECDGLTSVSIPEGVTKIGGLAFRNCRNLQTVSLPSTLASVGQYAFDGCSALTDVTYNGDQSSWQSVAIGANNEPLLNATITYVPSKPETITATGVKMSSSALNLTVGDTEMLVATVLPENATNKAVSWSSSDKSVATVSDGTVTAVAEGTATITVTTEDGGYTSSCTVTVNPVKAGNYPVIAVDDVRCHPGDTVSVAVALSANSGISNMRLSLSYPDGFVLTSIEKGDALANLTYTLPGDLTANPVNLVWDGIDGDTTEGTILTLNFSVPDDALEGNHPISLSYAAGDVLDGNLNDMELTIANGSVSVFNFTYGDVNGDDVINMKDLGLMRRYLAGGYEMSGFAEEAADVNADGTVNMKDLGLMRRYLAGGYDITFGK